MKEAITKQDLLIASFVDSDATAYAVLQSTNDVEVEETFFASTEVEAIYQAGEWVLKHI